jgi:hypothetical protein
VGKKEMSARHFFEQAERKEEGNVKIRRYSFAWPVKHE